MLEQIYCEFYDVTLEMDLQIERICDFIYYIQKSNNSEESRSMLYFVKKILKNIQQNYQQINREINDLCYGGKLGYPLKSGGATEFYITFDPLTELSEECDHVGQLLENNEIKSLTTFNMANERDLEKLHELLDDFFICSKHMSKLLKSVSTYTKEIKSLYEQLDTYNI